MLNDVLHYHVIKCFMVAYYGMWDYLHSKENAKENTRLYYYVYTNL
jgi:hypothetical protein